MKFLVKFVMTLMLLGIGGAYLYGRQLPREHAVTSHIVLVAPADSVFKVIRNVRSYPSWWSDVSSVERVRGSRGEVWRGNMGTSRSIEVELKKIVSGRSMQAHIVGGEEQGWGGVWYYEVRNTASGTEVTITEEGFIDSPVVRAFMKLRGRYSRVDSFLSSLGAHFGEVASPRHS